MNKSKQHWQEDSGDYTKSQYLFYLIITAVLLGGMGWLYYVNVKPKPVASTHLVTLFSEPGGELPVVPFHSEDLAALHDLIPEAAQHDFSFTNLTKEKIQEIVDASRDGFNEVSTVMIWLSGVGGVRNEKPVILGSDPDEYRTLEELIGELQEFDTKQVILVLDCNHGYANYEVHLNDEQVSDINQFAKLAAEHFATLEGKVSVIQYGLAAEKPIHSVVSRRSLLSVAIEKSFSAEARKNWTSQEFVEALDSQCLAYG
ncbi:MAG: hypothetical protein AAF939_22875, partial [Planctomycetota bacterium]